MATSRIPWEAKVHMPSVLHEAGKCFAQAAKWIPFFFSNLVIARSEVKKIARDYGQGFLDSGD